MKKTIFMILGLCYVTLALAAPALPGWHVITQSDGTKLKLQTVGNAFNNAILTTDGLTVAQGSDGDFYYESSVTGVTAVRAHEPEQRTAAEKAFVVAQRGSMTMQRTVSYMPPRLSGKLGATGSNASAAVPANGERHIPIILVEFQDKKFNNTREKIIKAMLEGEKSVGQYFADQSNNAYHPIFDVYGIYCLSQNREYYGGRSGNAKDKGIGWMVTEACQLASDDGVTFSPFDTNNDYYCDVVIIIYAGIGEAQASLYHSDAIWPCNWTLEAAKYYNRGGNGPFRPGPNDPYINQFAVFNELHGSNDSGKTIDGIGTFVHEFGHCLGLPDLYDTANSDHYGMGNWDIMCLGCYCDDGYTPVGYSAYEKVFMGWVDYIKPEPGTYYTLPVWNQKNKDTDKALCVVSDVNKNEYFIFENRKRVGWDAYLPGQGVLVTHITYVASKWTNNKPNNEDIQLVTLLPADNKLSKYTEHADTWPNGYNRDVTDNSTPATKLNMDAIGQVTGNAGYLGKPVTEIVINPDGTASFWYMKPEKPKPAITVSTNEIDFASIETNSSLNRTITVKGVNLINDVTVTINDATGVFKANPMVLQLDNLTSGTPLTVSFCPTGILSYFDTVTLHSDEAEDVTITLKGVGVHNYQSGDVNHDGIVNVTDITRLISYVMGESTDSCDICSDLNKDGYVNITDVTELINKVVAQGL